MQLTEHQPVFFPFPTLAAGVLFHRVAVPAPSPHAINAPAQCSQARAAAGHLGLVTLGDPSGAEGVLLLTGVSITHPTALVTMGTPQGLGPHQAQATPPTPPQTFAAATDTILLNVWLLSFLHLPAEGTENAI